MITFIKNISMVDWFKIWLIFFSHIRNYSAVGQEREGIYGRFYKLWNKQIISDIRKEFYKRIINMRYEKILKYSYEKLKGI